MAKVNTTGKTSNTQGALIDTEDFVREIVQSALQQFLEAEMTEHIGAAPYERSDGRNGLRNGYKHRTLKMRVGTIELSVPQARDGSFSTELFERFQRSEKAFTLAMMTMYIQGVSTRKVTDITESLCGTSFSKSTVSTLCKALDDDIKTWKKRDLAGHAYPYLFVDALYEDIRKAGSVTSSGILIVAGVRADGKREIVDVTIADTETTQTYEDMFSSLKARGLSGVKLVTSDAHTGLKTAISRYFQGAAWQRCQVHFIRDCMGKVSFKYRRELAADVNSIFAEKDRERALSRATAVADSWRDIAPKVAEMIDEDIEQCLSALAFPEQHQKRIRTNNGLERINEEVRRRTRVIRIFPNEASAMRVIATICMEKSETWMTGRQYLDMSLLNQRQGSGIERINTASVEEMRKVS